MGYYKNLTCGRCGASLSGGYQRVGIESNLGLPFAKCNKCFAKNRTGKQIWSKMNREQKKDYIISQVEQSVINGVALTLLLLLFLHKKLGIENMIEDILIWVIYGQIISGVLLTLWDIRLIKKLEKLYKKGEFDKVVM
jgi:hypothetical protein